MDRGAWWAIVHGVAESQTLLLEVTILSEVRKRKTKTTQYNLRVESKI